MGKIAKYVLRGLVVLALAGLVALSLMPQPLEVDLGEVSRGPMGVAVEEDGKTRIRERYTVSAPLSGRLLRVVLKAGDSVRAGSSTLATIEPLDPSLLNARELAVAEAQTQTAEAQLLRTGPELQRASRARELAENELHRIQELAQNQRASKQQLEQAEVTYQLRFEEERSAQFAQEIARYELELARAALLHTLPESDGGGAGFRLRIPAPIDGKVLRIFHESSTVVPAGTALLEVGDPRDLEVEVDVLSGDAVKILPGARVEFVEWGGSQPLRGRVRLVEPAAFTKVSALGVEEQRVNVIVDLLDPAEDRPTLGDGFRVEAHILIWEAEDVLKLPLGAAFRLGDAWAVFVFDQGVARLRPVELGHSNGNEAEVLSGLQPGEQVILHPSDALQDGSAVVSR